MKTKITLIVVAVAIVGLILWQGSKKNETFQVGALLCLTGPCAEWGENSLDGMRLAAEEINVQGGILGRQVEIVTEDSAEDSPTNSVTAYRSLRSRGIQYIIGPTWTNAGIAIAPVAANDEVIITSPSLGVKEFNETAPNIFNVWPHDDLASRALAQFAFSQGYRRAAIVSSLDSWYRVQGNALEEAFKEAGGTVTLKNELSLDRTDTRTDANKIIESKPDIVLYANLNNQGILAKDLRNFGYTGAQAAILMDDTRVNQAPGAFENAIFVQYAKADQTFIESVTDDLATVNKIYSDLKTYSGASGKLTFDGKGGVTKPPVFYVVKGTEFVEYQ